MKLATKLVIGQIVTVILVVLVALEMAWTKNNMVFALGCVLMLVLLYTQELSYLVRTLKIKSESDTKLIQKIMAAQTQHAFSNTLKTRKDYEAACNAAQKLADVQPALDSWQGEALVLLRILISEYEDKHPNPRNEEKEV